MNSGNQKCCSLVNFVTNGDLYLIYILYFDLKMKKQKEFIKIIVSRHTNRMTILNPCYNLTRQISSMEIIRQK